MAKVQRQHRDTTCLKPPNDSDSVK